ncbi:MAG TPA: lamin tail domain-containing protein [Propionibacteriaceae bacterium]
MYYSSPGAGEGSNSRLNAEHAVIRNGDSPTPSLGRPCPDAAGHRYTYPDGFRLGAGKQAIIHTGDGTSYTTSASTHRYWGREWYVWNDTGDKVILGRADGSLKDTCAYSGAGSKKYCYGIQNRRMTSTSSSGRAGSMGSAIATRPAAVATWWWATEATWSRTRSSASLSASRSFRRLVVGREAAGAAGRIGERNRRPSGWPGPRLGQSG